TRQATSIRARRREMIFPHKNCRAISLSCTILAPVMALACLLGTGSRYHARPGGPSAVDLAGFSALNPIDVHAHVFKNDPAFAALLRRLNLHVLDICVVDNTTAAMKKLHRRTRRRVRCCTAPA